MEERNLTIFDLLSFDVTRSLSPKIFESHTVHEEIESRIPRRTLDPEEETKIVKSDANVR